jgi:RimJ/RimL family protein N-acetyltransferase
MIISNQGRSLFLRQTQPDDAPILLRAYEDESFIRLYRSNNAKQTEEQLRETLEKRAKIPPTKIGYLEFMIIHKKYGEIGVAALGDYSVLHRRAEYLVGLFEENRRYAGYGIETTMLTLDLAFNVYKLHKIYSYVYEYNDFSQKNMMSFGFKHEGTLEKHHFLLREQRFVDLHLNGMTEERFRQNERVARLSQRLVGRDITKFYEDIAVSESDKLPQETGRKFLEGLRAMADQQQAGNDNV